MPAGQSLVKDLVDQFERPLDFYRELIQNSLDAGSNRIDVSLRFKPGRPGTAVIRVEDDGEGMDERVIDDCLLVLFSSSKENDLTKIGKFGIGFMSVFAPRPKLVRVYTAKGGESWRLDFPSWRHYEKYRVKEPREGTLVELLKDLPRRDYDALVRQSRDAVSYWCKHAQARIYFQDLAPRAATRPSTAGATDAPGAAPELVTKPFSLEAGESLRYAEEGTEAVLGFSDEPRPFFGFYNRGLTLKEGKKAYFPGVAFKLSSRFLEHTLTRDNVLEDDNFGKAMKIVSRLVDEELPKKLRGELEEIAARASSLAREKGPGPELGAAGAAWARHIPYLHRLFSGLLAGWRYADWRVFPSLSGAAATYEEVKDGFSRAGGGLKVLFDERRGPVADWLSAEGIPVLAPGPWVQAAADWHGAEAVKASEAFVFPQLLREVPPETAAFLRSVAAVEARREPRFRDLLAADFDYPGSSIKNAFFVSQNEAGRPSSAFERSLAPLLRADSRKVGIINVSHPVARSLLSLHARRPALAAFLCAKIIRLHGDAGPSDEKTPACRIDEAEERDFLAAALSEEGRG